MSKKQDYTVGIAFCDQIIRYLNEGKDEDFAARKSIDDSIIWVQRVNSGARDDDEVPHSVYPNIVSILAKSPELFKNKDINFKPKVEDYQAFKEALIGLVMDEEIKEKKEEAKDRLYTFLRYEVNQGTDNFTIRRKDKNIFIIQPEGENNRTAKIYI